MNNKEEKNGQLQIDLPQDLAKGVYSNFALIAHSSSEFVVDFATMMPGVAKASVCSRVLLAPEHAKRLLAALHDNVMKYESEYGPIMLRNGQSRTISPFGNNKGEA